MTIEAVRQIATSLGLRGNPEGTCVPLGLGFVMPADMAYINRDVVESFLELANTQVEPHVVVNLYQRLLESVYGENIGEYVDVVEERIARPDEVEGLIYQKVVNENRPVQMIVKKGDVYHAITMGIAIEDGNRVLTAYDNPEYLPEHVSFYAKSIDEDPYGHEGLNFDTILMRFVKEYLVQGEPNMVIWPSVQYWPELWE